MRGRRPVLLALGDEEGDDAPAVFEHDVGEASAFEDAGHAEAVRVTYDPSRITYSRLIKIFCSVAHDPTQLNRQGPDTGTHYRSAIFYADDEQRRVAQAYIKQLDQSKAFGNRIVTQVGALDSFYQVETYH